MAIRRVRNPQVIHPLAETDLITVEMEWDEKTRNWVSYVPELNHLSDYGPSYEEALNRTADAILLYLDVSEQTGSQIPLSHRKVRLLRELLAK